MSLRALHSAATGMEAFQFNLDNIANNLANASTTAYKQSRVNFEDLFYQHMRAPGVQDSLGQTMPLGRQVGLGTRINSTAMDFTQGNMLETGKPLDIAIVGDGFFQVQDTQQILYTRAGNFSMNDQGQLVITTGDRGRLLDPPITIPQTATNITISADGTVSATEAGQQTAQNLGQIQTVRFINPQGLIQQGENLFAVSQASGQPLTGNPGIDGRGPLRQFFLESSNVEPVRELVDLIKTQRNFELNSQVVQAADQTLQLIANLRRY